MALRQEDRARFDRYVDRLAQAVGHADRRAPLERYLTGLLLPGERKSIEPMAAKLDPRHVSRAHQSLHHFVANAPWEARELLAVARDYALTQLERHAPVGAWVVDDTGIPKKGTQSVGVARQYCGALGKQANCQVAVTVSLANTTMSVPAAWRLYVPEHWAEDRKRRRATGIPEAIGFLKKWQIALDEIDTLLLEDLPPAPVVADAGYGDTTEFRDALTDRGLSYALGIKGETTVWPPGTAPLPPRHWTGRGRPPARVRRDAQHKPRSAREVARGLRPKQWTTVRWREGTRGTMSSRFAALRVRPAHRDTLRSESRPVEWALRMGARIGACAAGIPGRDSSWADATSRAAHEVLCDRNGVGRRGRCGMSGYDPQLEEKLDLDRQERLKEAMEAYAIATPDQRPDMFDRLIQLGRVVREGRESAQRRRAEAEASNTAASSEPPAPEAPVVAAVPAVTTPPVGRTLPDVCPSCGRSFQLDPEKRTWSTEPPGALKSRLANPASQAPPDAKAEAALDPPASSKREPSKEIPTDAPSDPPKDGDCEEGAIALPARSPDTGRAVRVINYQYASETDAWYADDPEGTTNIVMFSDPPVALPQPDGWTDSNWDELEAEIPRERTARSTLVTKADRAGAYVGLGLSLVQASWVEKDGRTCCCSRGSDCDNAGGHWLQKGKTANALSTRDQSMAAYSKSPRAGVGLATGARFETFAIVFSPDAERTGSLNRIQSLLPATQFRWITDKGFKIIALRYPRDRTLRSGFVQGLTGVRVVGEDNFVLLPPSKSAKEGLYSYPAGRGPLAPSAMAQASEELLELLSRITAPHRNGGAW